MNFDTPPANPLPLFQEWLSYAASHAGMLNHNAMVLATTGIDGAPAARVVLLKDIDDRGAVFYTNRLSRKGQELHAHPRAALVFYWDALGRQVRIAGEVTEVSDSESDAYFATRPRDSQVGAWASAQSQPALNREQLDAAFDEASRRFANMNVPRPPHWGGYRISLNSIEFWQAHPFRLHDRVVYTRDPAGTDSWVIKRLQP